MTTHFGIASTSSSSSSLEIGSSPPGTYGQHVRELVAHRPVDRLCVRVEQQLGRVEAQPALRLVRTAHAVAVALTRPDTGQVAVPDEGGAFAYLDAASRRRRRRRGTARHPRRSRRRARSSCRGRRRPGRAGTAYPARPATRPVPPMVRLPRDRLRALSRVGARNGDLICRPVGSARLFRPPRSRNRPHPRVIPG